MRKAFLAAGFDLTPEQWGVLTRLKNNEGMNQNQLAERTLKDRHNINRILNLLEKRRYIVRCSDASDKRAHRIFLTESGKMIQENSTLIFMDHLRKRFKNLGAKDLAALRRILEQISKNIKEIDSATLTGIKTKK